MWQQIPTNSSQPQSSQLVPPNLRQSPATITITHITTPYANKKNQFISHSTSHTIPHPQPSKRIAQCSNPYAILFPSTSSRSSRNLHRLLNAIGRRRIDLLARLGNLAQDRLVRQSGDDLGGLILQRDFVALDACACQHPAQLDGDGDLPSSFLRTRSMAPEQPPQLMETLNS